MIMETLSPEKLLTRREAATLLKVQPQTIDRWIKAGKLKAYKMPLGRSVRIDAESVKNAIFGKGGESCDI